MDCVGFDASSAGSVSPQSPADGRRRRGSVLGSVTLIDRSGGSWKFGSSAWIHLRLPVNCSRLMDAHRRKGGLDTGVSYGPLQTRKSRREIGERWHMYFVMVLRLPFVPHNHGKGIVFSDSLRHASWMKRNQEYHGKIPEIWAFTLKAFFNHTLFW